MQLSTKGRYAIMALTDIAHQISQSGNDFEVAPAIRLGAISERQNISLAYLEQLFVKLRRADIVVSVRGPGGGYRLKKTPQDTTLADIILAVDEPFKMTRCDNTKEQFGCINGERCLTHGLWVAMGQHLLQFFKAITLQDVLDKNFICPSAFVDQNFAHQDTANTTTHQNIYNEHSDSEVLAS